MRCWQLGAGEGALHIRKALLFRLCQVGAVLHHAADLLFHGRPAQADFLGEVCEKVYYLPLYKEEPHFTHDNIVVVREKPVEIKGAMKVSELVTDQNAYTVDGVFILRAAQFPAQLVPGLAAEGNAVKVDLQMRTNLPGLFAAGDIAGQPYQYIKAAGQGNVAALSAVNYIDEKKRAK